MIDWEKIAKSNGLTNKEFCKEVFQTACCLGVMSLDNRDDDGCLKFTCSDKKSEIEMFIRRTDNKN